MFRKIAYAVKQSGLDHDATQNTKQHKALKSAYKWKICQKIGLSNQWSQEQSQHLILVT